jgi:hypothetical protein
MIQPIDIRHRFNEKQYVERSREMNEANRWLADDRDRVLLITSPPATGKTWFLHFIRNQFEQDEVAITFWVDVKTLLPQTEPPAEVRQAIDPEKQRNWLQSLAQEIQKKCEHVPHFQPGMDDGEYIEIALNKLCSPDCEPNKPIVIFVDQGDEVTDSSWREFENKILQGRFFAVDGIKFVIAFRGEQRLYSKLKWSQRFLPLGIFSEGVPGNRPGEEQFKKLIGDETAVQQQLQKILDSIPGYKRNHAGLNTFLYHYAAENLPLPLSYDALKAALLSLNPLIGGEIDHVAELLLGIADFHDEWTAEQWAIRQLISNSEADEQIQKLKDYDLLINVSADTSTNSNIYIVLEGLREFIWAVLEITSVISIKTEVKADDAGQVLLYIEDMTGTSIEPLQIRAEGKGFSLTTALSADKAHYLWELRKHEDRQIQDNRITDIQYVNFTKLKEQINNHFNEDDLRELCFDMGIAYDALNGGNKRSKTIALIEHCKNHVLLEELLAYLKKARPRVIWQL